MLCAVSGEQFYNVSPLTFAGSSTTRQHRRQPARLHQRLLPERARRPREVRLRRADRPARPGRPPVPRASPSFCRDRPAPRHRLERGDGLPLRGTHPTLLRALQRDGRRALHSARGDPAHGQPPLHRGRRRSHERRASCAPSTTRPAAPAACSPSPRTTSASSTRRPARGVRPGAQRRDLRHLPLRHDAQGPGRLRTSAAATPSPRTATQGEPSTTCSPIRRSGWSGRRSRTQIRERARELGFAGRFGAGFPASTTARFLFLQHMICAR